MSTVNKIQVDSIISFCAFADALRILLSTKHLTTLWLCHLFATNCNIFYPISESFLV